MNVIVTAALSPKTKLSVPALQFFLSSDQLMAEEDEEDEDVCAENFWQQLTQERRAETPREVASCGAGSPARLGPTSTRPG